MPVESFLTIGPPLGGVRFDLPENMVPPQFATSLLNVDLTGAELTKRPGSVGLGTNLPLGSPVIGLFQYMTFSGQVKTLACTMNNIYQLSSTKQWTSIKDATTWLPSVDWGTQFAFFLDKVILTNGVDPIRTWDGEAATVTVLPNSNNYRAKELEAFSSRVMYFNLIESGSDASQRVRWTAPGTADDFTGPGSGFVDLLDSPSPILAGIKLAEGVAIYKKDSIVFCSYVGGNSIFNFDTRVSSRGLIAHKAVVDIGRSHLFIAGDNVFEFNGSRDPTPVGDAVRGYINKSLKGEFAHRIIARKFNNQAWFFVPVESSYPDIALVFDIDKGTWCINDFHVTSCGLYFDYSQPTIGDLTGNIGDLTGAIGEFGNMALRPQIMFGDESGNIGYISNMYISDNGVAIKAMWQSGDLLMVEENKILDCRFRYLELDAKGDTIDIEFSTDGGLTWKEIGVKTLTSSWGWNRIYFDAFGNRIRIRLSNQVQNQTFYIRGMRLAFLKDVIR